MTLQNISLLFMFYNKGNDRLFSKAALCLTVRLCLLSEVLMIFHVFCGISVMSQNARILIH